MEIEIKPPCWEGYKYSLWFNKGYGDCFGGTREYKTKEELLEAMKEVIKAWEGYDSIVQRMGDKITKKNLEFKSFTDEIGIADIFGEHQLTAWM